MEWLNSFSCKVFIWFVIQPRNEFIEEQKKEGKEEHSNALKDSCAD